MGRNIFPSGDSDAIFDLGTMNSVRIIASPMGQTPIKYPSSLASPKRIFQKSPGTYFFQYAYDSAYVFLGTDSGCSVSSIINPPCFLETGWYYLDKVNEGNFKLYSTKADSEVVSFTLPPKNPSSDSMVKILFAPITHQKSQYWFAT